MSKEAVNIFQATLRDGMADLIRANGKSPEYLAEFLRKFDSARSSEAAFAEFIWKQMAFNIKLTETIVSAAADDKDERNRRLADLVKQLSAMQNAVSDAVTSILSDD